MIQVTTQDTIVTIRGQMHQEYARDSVRGVEVLGRTEGEATTGQAGDRISRLPEGTKQTSSSRNFNSQYFQECVIVCCLF